MNTIGNILIEFHIDLTMWYQISHSKIKTIVGWRLAITKKLLYWLVQHFSFEFVNLDSRKKCKARRTCSENNLKSHVVKVQ